MQNLMRLHCRAPISPALFEEEAMGRSRGRGRQVANLHHARGCPCHTAHPAQLLPPAHTQMHPFVPKLKAMEVMSFLSSSCLGSDSDHIEEKQFPGFFCSCTLHEILKWAHVPATWSKCSDKQRPQQTENTPLFLHNPKIPLSFPMTQLFAESQPVRKLSGLMTLLWKRSLHSASFSTTCHPI